MCVFRKHKSEKFPTLSEMICRSFPLLEITGYLILFTLSLSYFLFLVSCLSLVCLSVNITVMVLYSYMARRVVTAVCNPAMHFDFSLYFIKQFEQMLFNRVFLP